MFRQRPTPSMIVTFKSKAATEVTMYAEHAAALLSLVGKSLDPPTAPRGIITAAEVPAALEKLKSAADSARRKSREDSSSDRDDEPGRPAPVGLAQRAFPLIEMLERAAKDGRDVVWGV